MELGLYGEKWQVFVDKFNEKYDAQTIEGFDFDPVSISYNWQQLVKRVSAKVLPTYVDPESEGFELPLGDIAGVSGNIPTQKLFYSVNRTIVREQMQLAQRFGRNVMDGDMANTMFNLLYEGTDGLIQSFYNALKHQREQVISTGKFKINATNNPRGLKGITIDFGVPSANKDTLTSDARWWTSTTHTSGNQGSASDPILYLKNRVKTIRQKYAGPLKMEISKALWDDMLTHTAVTAALAAAMYPNAASAQVAAQSISYQPEDAIKALIQKIIAVDAIDIKDTYAYVSAPDTTGSNAPDLVVTKIDNFDAKTVSFLPTGKVGSIQGVQPLSMGYNESDVAYFLDNRLLIELEGIPRTHSINVNGEMGQLCVPSAVNELFISVVTA